MQTRTLPVPVKLGLGAIGIFLVSALILSVFLPIGFIASLTHMGWVMAAGLSVGVLVIQALTDEEDRNRDENVWVPLMVGQIIMAILGIVGLLFFFSVNHTYTFLNYAWAWSGIFCTGTFMYSSCVWLGRWIMDPQEGD